MKEFRNPSDVHPPVAGYSHQVELRGPQRLLMLSGQVGMRPDGSMPDDPIEQLEIAWDNVRRNLRAAGMDVADLMKLTTYVVGEMDTTRRRAVTAARLGAHRPCMTMVFVAALYSPACKVELDAWASRGE